VDEVAIVNKETGVKGKVLSHTPVNSLQLLMATKFLVGLFLHFLEDVITKQLIQSFTQYYNLAGTQVLYQVHPVQNTMADNRYCMKYQWTNNWGNHVGGKLFLEPIMTQ
jgi:hypothetical protein